MNIDYNAAAEEMDALKDTGRELEGAVRVNARVSKEPRAVVTIRMRADEQGEISRAADALGQNFGEFVREVALERARFVVGMKAGRISEAEVKDAMVSMMAKRMGNAAALLDQAQRELTRFEPGTQAVRGKRSNKRIPNA